MKNAGKIMINTLLLTGASFLMQTVGVSFNVWLTARMGSVGIGLFQLIMTVYNLAVTLGCGGVRLAATRLTVESEARGESVRKTVVTCIKYAFVTGTLIAFALISLSDIAAKYWLSDMRSAAPLRILALSLPFVSMSSALNGYFTAVKKVFRYSAVRIAEQGVKIAIVMFLMSRLLPYGIEYGSIAIIIGILLSEAFSFTLLIILYNTEKKKYREKAQNSGLKRILHIAVPDVSGAGARSVLLTIEHLLIPKGFEKSGSSASQALSVYGNIHGMVFPLILYPSAILSSLSSLLIPEIASHRENRRDSRITYIIARVMKITLIFSIGTAGIFYIFADGLSYVIYNSYECADYIRMLSVLIPVMYCDMTVDGILKGMDQQMYSMWYNIIDSALCVVLVAVLLPKFAVKGYIFILFASEIINFFLSIQRLMKVCEVDVRPVKEIFVPICCIICSSCSVSLLCTLTGFTAIYTELTLAVAIVMTAMVYVLFLYGFSTLTREDITWFSEASGIHHLKNRCVNA
ncbi:MAG: polysaccharide biosynthesis C-terminal domain-containing protein [Clostridia bacterium]|nr:polysaccharide biosynthesis C-terminal domain-containing protein [Clostridia bacterium]